MRYFILLTGCINPNGMPFTSLTDISVRVNQYINAIRYYLQKTNFPIIFVENSGTDIRNSINFNYDDERFEFISFDGNTNKKKGKGYGEVEIIDYALTHSRILASLSNNCQIVKITGRLIVNNISTVVLKKFCFQNSNSIVVSYNSDFSFADSRLIIAPKGFFKSFIEHKEEINDSDNIFLEHVLSNNIKNSNTYRYYPFYIEPQITGQSGTTGEKYTPYKASIKRRNLYLIYVLRQILIFDKKFSKHKIKRTIKIIYTASYYALLIFCKLYELLLFNKRIK